MTSQKMFSQSRYIITVCTDKYLSLKPYIGLAEAESYSNRVLEKECVKLTEELYSNRVFPYTFAGKYCYSTIQAVSLSSWQLCFRFSFSGSVSELNRK